MEALRVMLARGDAYFVDTEAGRFLCCRAVAAARLPFEPLAYPLLRGRLAAPGDFPAWAPYADGPAAPWGGAGLLTVNGVALEK